MDLIPNGERHPQILCCQFQCSVVLQSSGVLSDGKGEEQFGAKLPSAHV